MFGFWRNWIDAAQFAVESQQVMAMRLMRIAPGGVEAMVETQRMVSEKAAAFLAAHMAAATALAAGGSFDTAARKAAIPYRSRVRSNHRRLTRLGK